MAGRSSGHITHSVLSLHLPAVSDLHLQAWNAFNLNMQPKQKELVGLTQRHSPLISFVNFTR